MLRPISDSKFVVVLGWLVKYVWFALLGCSLVIMLSTVMGHGTEVVQWFMNSQELLARLVLLVGCAGMSLVLLESLR